MKTFNSVLLSNLSHQRTAPKRYFAKMPLHLDVTFLTHRNMQRHIEKYADTSIVTLNCNGKDLLRVDQVLNSYYFVTKIIKSICSFYLISSLMIYNQFSFIQ